MIKMSIDGDIDKIQSYLSDYNIKLSEINIFVKDGGWTLDILGRNQGNNIYVYLPKWIFFQREKAIAKIILHEYLHIKGLERCLSNSRSCIMYESTWYGEILSMPFQWIKNWSLCSKCKKFYEEIIKIEETKSNDSK